MEQQNESYNLAQTLYEITKKPLKQRLAEKVLFATKNKLIWAKESGGFRVTLKTFTLEIESISENFYAKFTATDNHPYGYIYWSVQNEQFDNVFGFAQTIYRLSKSITSDKGLVDDVQKSMRKFDNRLLAKAQSEVKANAQPKSIEDATLQNELRIIDRANMTPKERKRAEKEFEEQVKHQQAIEQMEEQERINKERMEQAQRDALEDSRYIAEK